MKARVIAVALSAFFIGEAQAEVCIVGKEVWIAGCEANCTASWEGSNCPQSCTAAPPPGFIIVNHRSRAISQSNGGHSISRIAAGQTFDYTRAVQQAYKYALDLAGEKGRDALKGRISQDMAQAVNEAERFSSSHQMLRLTVSANKHGSFVDRRRGWSHHVAEMLVRCVAPADLQRQIAQKYGL